MSVSRSTATATLLLRCRDRKGLVAALAQLLYDHGANILDAQQHTDSAEQMFFQRIHFDLTEIDLLYRDEGVIIELDSKRIHLTLARFESDRRRDSALLARGYLTVRVTWQRLLHDQERLAHEIRAILLSRARTGTG